MTEKWQHERQYRLRKELFAYTDNKIAVQFWYEYTDGGGRWFRCYGLEDWTFAADGRMEKRMMSANEIEIGAGERWFGEGVSDVDGVRIGEEHW